MTFAPVEKKYRSTGWRSQNTHIHGHYSDIAAQLSGDGKEYNNDLIGKALKRLAATENMWPTVMNPIDGVLDVISEASATSKECAQYIEFIHYWADTNQLWLTEYIDGRPEKVYGGSIKRKELEK